MAETLILMDVVLPNGVRLPASLFDDRNYVEVTDDWLNNTKSNSEAGGATDSATDNKTR